MALNLDVFKKGKSVYWIIGAIVLFVIFYLLASGGSKSTGSGAVTTSVINSGPSDAQLAAGAAVQTAQIQASVAANESAAQVAAIQSQTNAQVAIATLQFQGDLANTQAGADVAKYVAALDANVATSSFTAQTNALQIQSEYSFATAKVAAETDLAKNYQNNTLLLNQLQTNAAMFHDQVQGLNFQALVGQIGAVKSNDRDNAFALAAASLQPGGTSYHDSGSGSFTTTG